VEPSLMVKKDGMILEKISPLGDSEVKNMNNYNDIQIIIMAGGIGSRF